MIPINVWEDLTKEESEFLFAFVSEELKIDPIFVRSLKTNILKLRLQIYFNTPTASEEGKTSAKSIYEKLLKK